MIRNVPPPQRPPIHNEPISGEESVPPADMLATLTSLLSTALDLDGPWVVGGWQVSLVGKRQPECSDPLEADFRATDGKDDIGVTLRIEVHPSGWLEAHVTVDGGAQKTFFIEHVYEEFEIWPPGSPCEAIDSGRMGKRCRWVQLEAQFWPDLAFLAQGRFITLEQRDKER